MHAWCQSLCRSWRNVWVYIIQYLVHATARPRSRSACYSRTFCRLSSSLTCLHPSVNNASPISASSARRCVTLFHYDHMLARWQSFIWNEIACTKEIIALTDCHSSWKKFFGQCNGLKNELTLCLRAEVSHIRHSLRSASLRLVIQRLERRKQNHDDAKAKRAKVEVLWKTIDEES